jgi:hypothetical protein
MQNRRALWAMFTTWGLAGVQIYVTGPTDWSRCCTSEAFAKTVGLLRSLGARVVSPLDLLDLLDGDGGGVNAGLSLVEAVARDISTLLASDLVVLMDGWEDSPTTRIDVLTAYGAGIPCVPLAAALEAV